ERLLRRAGHAAHGGRGTPPPRPRGVPDAQGVGPRFVPVVLRRGRIRGGGGREARGGGPRQRLLRQAPRAGRPGRLRRGRRPVDGRGARRLPHLALRWRPEGRRADEGDAGRGGVEGL
ncbi:MAG: hypothetical protein AVDCRST_MAG12-3006, partial [uncultured Rubrobacteraceae bacterium]